MTETVRTGVLQRDRTVVIAAIVAITLLAWSYIMWMAMHMPMGAPPSGKPAMTSMPGMEMPSAAGPSFTPWTPAQFCFVFAMWAVMMVGMMVPSVTPMVLLYARVARQAAASGRPFAPTGWFVAGYVVAWVGFSLLATGAQWALEGALMLSPATTTVSSLFGGVVLIAAGLYQWTPVKNTCLTQCQAPFMFIQRHGGFRRDPLGSLRLGLQHGLFCVGCCWALMLVLFVVGVMNVLWIAAITVFILVEKVVPGRALSRIAGTGLIFAGGWVILS